MTLAHLTFKIRNSIYVHPGDGFFDFFTLCIIITFFLQHVSCTVKTSIFLLYNLGMRYRLSLLSIQSAQSLLRSDNLGSTFGFA